MVALFRSARRALVMAGAAAALAPAVSPAAGQPAETIDWSIQRGGSTADGSKVQLTVESRWGVRNHSSWSNDRPISDLQGLSAAQLLGSPGPARFTFVREAGRLDCSGVAGNRSGSGGCTLSPDASFAAYLQARRMGVLSRDQVFSLTMSGVGRGLVDAMQTIGYVRPNIDQLVAMGIHGVTPQFVRGLAQAGYRLRSADDLVAFSIHGVDLDYIRAMAAIGPQFAHIDPGDLVSLRIHGVTPDYARQMAAFTPVTADDLVSLSIHGAEPELVQTYLRYNSGTLRSDDIVSMAIHGVTASYLEQLAALGYRNLTADNLVSMSIHGVTPDFVRSLRRAGMSPLPADQLVRLRMSGFDPGAR